MSQHDADEDVMRDISAVVTFPLAEHVAAQTVLQLVPCPITRELYGCIEPVLDIDATMQRFTTNYVAATATELEPFGHGPGTLERDHAAATFEARYVTVREKMR